MAPPDPFVLLAERLSARRCTIEAVVVRAGSDGPVPGARACLEPSGDLLAGAWAETFAAELGSVAAGLSAARPAALVAPAPGLQVFLLHWAPPPRIVLFGGGHVGRAIAALLPPLGLEALVIEDREFFADPRRFPPSVRVMRSPLADGAAAAGIGEGDFAVVCTRGHKEDLDCVRALMPRDPAYFGLLGSRRKLREFSALLEAEGHALERLARIRCPVGLDLGAETPEEIAVAVVAEILAVRHGRPLARR